MRCAAVPVAVAVALGLAPASRARSAGVDGPVIRTGAASVGQDLPPTAVPSSATPRAGTPLIAARRTVGIGLPMPMLIKEEAGEAHVAHDGPRWLGARHGLTGQDTARGWMVAALEKLAQAAAGP